MSNRIRIQIATIVASLAVLTGLPDRLAATELAKQEIINNLAITPVPGTSSTEQWNRSGPFDNPRIDNAGNVVFGAVMNSSSPGGVVATSNRRGVWYGGPGTLQMIARDGTTTPVAPLTAGMPLPNPNSWWLNSTTNGTGLASTPTLAPNGTMFILGQLNGTGATTSNNTAFWTGQAGSLGIVAQRGFLPAPYGVAPGTGGMAWNSNLNSSQAGVNNAGQVMFTASLLANETRNVSTLSGAAGTVTATTSFDHGYAIGTSVVIAGATPAGYNGNYVVASVPNSTTFTYANATTGAATGNITASTGRVTLMSSGPVVTATTANPHNYAVGQSIIISGSAPSNYNGTFLVATTPDANTFTFNYTPTIRTVNSMVGNGTTVTATTSGSHGFAVGQSVEITGAFPLGYNGIFVITATTSTTFTYADATTGASSGVISATVVVPTGTIIANRANTDGLWVGSPSAINLVMQRDEVAPGQADPDLRLDASPTFGQTINGSGAVAIVTKVRLGTGTPPVTTDNDYVLYAGTPGSMSIIARENDEVPGLGGPQYVNVPATTFSAPFSVLTGGNTNDNSVYFYSTLAGSGVVIGVDDAAIFRYNGGTTSVVLRRGDAAPGMPGVTFSSIGSSGNRANNNGTILVGAVLSGPGITADNNDTAWIKTAGNPAVMIAQEGVVLNLPDLPPGTYINGNFMSSSPGLNNLDQVVMSVNLAGPGITLDNDRAILAWDPVGGLILVAQSGNDYGIVTDATQVSIGVGFQNGEGGSSGFSDTGWLCMTIANSNTQDGALFRTKIVAMGACCYTDGSPCQMTTQANCPTGNLWRSDLTTCPVSCPTIGKCCYIDGTCDVRFQENCSGTSWIAGQDCTEPCPLPGACCDANTGLCSFVPQSLCTGSNVWTGGADCTMVACLGSCCDPAYGSCMISLKVDCVSPKIWTLGGTCTPNGCTQPTGACCLIDGTCVQATPGDCDFVHNSIRWTPGACSTCPGIPALIKSGLATNASGLSPDGNTVVSPLFHGDTATSPFHKYTRGTGYSELAGGAEGEGGQLFLTNNATVVSADQPDDTNASGLSPAFNRLLGKRWTSASGIWNLLGATGVPGGTPAPNQCDFTINGVKGMSDDGRYVLVSGWSTNQCGPFRIWRFDSNGIGSWSSAASLGTGSSQNNALGFSGDGNTIVGWDMNAGTRKAAVWTFSLIQGGFAVNVLDPSAGQSEIYAVNNNGTVIVGYMSPEGMTAAFGTDDRLPVRWTRPTATSSVWTRTNLGGVDGMIPTHVSNDGNTIVGVGGTASDAWIWQPHMTAPMDLALYLTRTGVDLPALGVNNFGAPLSRGISGMSRDGNVILGSYTADTPCLTTGGGILVYLNGTGIACEPPRIIFHPVPADQTTYSPFGAILNCFAGGSLDLNYQWQKQDENDPQVWNDIFDDNCAGFDFYRYKGTQGPQLRVGLWLEGPFNDLRGGLGNYRCVVTNSCGSVTTNPAAVRLGGACCFFDSSCRVLMESSTTGGAQGCVEQGGVFNGNFTTCDVNPCILYGDLNCDTILNGLDVQAFVFAVIDPGTYFANYPGCNINTGDTNSDSLVDVNDIPSFVNLLTGP